MLDIQFIRDNPDAVAKKAAQKGYPIDVKRLLELDEQRRQAITAIEALRAERNELSAALKKTKPTSEQIEQGKSIKDSIAQAELELAPIDQQYDDLLRTVPNMPLQDVPAAVVELRRDQRE